MSTNPLPRCHDSAWFFLHVFILNIPPSRLFLFPALAGSVWFLTLASLLLIWLVHGMPQYPGQSNQHVAFISDIASFELKPLFLVGASITAVGFVTTVAAVHVVRYEPGFALVKCTLTDNRNDNDDHDLTGHSSSYNRHCDHHESYSEDEEDHETTRSLKLISLLAIFAAGVASIALILLAVMDTFRYKSAHHLFLQVCFAGLAIQSACTAIVYSNEVLGFVSYVYHLGVWQHDWGRRSLRVRVFASLSTALIITELFLGVAFISLTVPEEAASYRKAGILEWIIAFLGTIYLWLFCGFLDQTNFDGYVPSVLYGPPVQRKDVQPPESLRGQIRNWDPERAHLIEGPTGGKYT
ncbi:Frag1/DRAM/Sfk1 family-domain-containing protein [Aspergillus pseudotamarii]|uniref:Frag1/DRAM/Sfk1 family-domain-containing protein n=1 Tax=Aspergillus pseudotamarii TaxID=132259 RepID=A0A5N6SK23_ASPPS|nr:Frag1/DRAM/Sfk1 family-domain-containing protein [Aspergillus pseudotamarii]KAE8134041.1 Frag1/DRAM/Sfk1 family-domain-containing protein [Aspergillus pseudotamarii]